MGYHISKIDKGIFGDSSKILEEIQELQDAELQNIKIMVIIELSDLYASIDGYIKKHYPFLSMEDLSKMAAATNSAFMDGSRK